MERKIEYSPLIGGDLCNFQVDLNPDQLHKQTLIQHQNPKDYYTNPKGTLEIIKVRRDLPCKWRIRSLSQAGTMVEVCYAKGIQTSGFLRSEN